MSGDDTAAKGTWEQVKQALLVVDGAGLVVAATVGASELFHSDEPTLVGSQLAEYFSDPEACHGRE